MTDRQKMVAIAIGIALLAAVIIIVARQKTDEVSGPRSGSVAQAAVEAFTEEAREEVRTELGQPIEGYEPFMFLEVFPGLEESDFDGVDALIGGYVYQNGEVVYDLQGEAEIHSAARAISDEGMETLLVNVAERLDIDLGDDGTIDDVLDALRAGEVESGLHETTFEGEIVCLPHKDTSGPVTLECAFGLRTAGGVHFGLQNLFDGVPSSDLNTGSRVRIEGELLPPAANEKYDIHGVIDVHTVETL